ncbi:UDP-3-O-(3-hydroxymyristoyl)glucosamine N-acyltransferase [Kingella kingae]|uniref:UDP-3-O-(3-hydroxymyristoyl)glucosamine N-acyltransferase n=1 Tax=Kingella kingae TaxID=504 RepID=UPI0009B79AD9|nr:UDP-3-O-(3-hydroxymyristoyl)glucosamine N-acyltransferase [Kingella kingae]MDK4544813.1 UDP-3-O-(3-hydroxymyristoyl)glucosamine N-acyltransferase [Kingella kingae]MDK4566896.1 UDP-3-O-(3-hydroxymyristoyl)glucosamine N-acyltransferase [Kingella kingae]MDK4590716.1 UDP-3-O-(3-hydroxymyristoyl)glucosamine N-acyltransferase [Kingella kingae]MDK4628561.1 UDP-3-O-(3-hydroxymyristoyl)glucosamine N-acyltransferase [Kingella kingae]MDK4636458.1 UDP-3-O-(3-hydroxymyristoyl)glucosamine N-acyltransfera
MFTLSQIVAKLGGEWRGQDITVDAIAPAARAQSQHITFLANPKYKQEVSDSQAGAVIVSAKNADLFPDRNLIIAPDAYLYFAQVARLFHPVQAACAGVHPTAVIEASATVPASCEIGANVYIGANTVLGERCRILANSVVEHDCILGDDTVLHPNVTVYYGCTLGKCVEIHSGAVIGADGFGLAFAGDSWFKIPQTGAVTLGDDVEVGANTTIDRGAMSDTTVGRGTKIDNQIQLAHNCKVGEHTVIAAMTGISGSTSIGSFCVIGGGVGTVGHIEIADKTTIGGGTLVTHSIKESGTHYASIFPMQTYKEWARNAVHINHLNEMHKRIKALEKQLAQSSEQES